MPRPGTDITIVDGAPPGTLSLDTGTAFMVGQAERGPTDRAVKVPSLDRYADIYGDRSGGSLLYDSVGAFFAEGGSSLYVGRVANAGMAAATGTLGGVLDADAASPGAWGNGLVVSVEAPSSRELLRATGRTSAPSVIVVELDGEVVDRSYVVNSPDEAEAWSQGRDYVVLTVTSPGDLPPAGTSVTLSGGVDGTGAYDMDGALALFEYGLGPGQVLAPGYTTTSVHTSVLAHCDDMRRCAVLDFPDSGDPTVLAAAVDALRDLPGIRFAAAFAPWAVYPAEVAPATVTIPYSAIQAGIIARVDRAGNPNAPAAGIDGISNLALGLSQTFTDYDRQTLNELGIDLAKEVYGDIRTYGYRTAAGPDDKNWLWYGNSRTLMALSYEFDAIAETYVLKQIDGRRQLFSRLNKDLAAVCARFYDMGALYGETPADAYLVDTGPGVNTDETIAAGEVHAVVRVRCSPAAEWVSIRIVKVPVERPVAA